MTRMKYKEAVGLDVKRGRPPLGKKPSKIEFEKLYVKEEMSIREIAKLIGFSKDMVYRSLKENKIERRPGFNRSKLRCIKLSDLEKEIKEKGLRRVAREYKVAHSTLSHHIKVRRESDLYRSRD